MMCLYYLATIFSTISIISATSESSSVTTTPQPVYKPPDNYVPHATYPYAETYPVPGYDNFLIPAGPVHYPNMQNDKENDDTSVSNVPVSKLILLFF